MKILKRIGLGLLLLIALIFIIGLFLPKETHVTREVTIAKPRSEVFAYVKDIRNQDQYGKWNLEDPNMDKSYRGTPGTPGFVAAWDSKKVGKGEQEITKVTEGERIDMDLRFEKPFKSNATSFMTTSDADGGQTKVVWGYDGHSDYPMNIMGFAMKSMLGSAFQEGLNNMKRNLESSQPISQHVQ
jgi:uncharacterized protein YndB with AHSA1/START domain